MLLIPDLRKLMMKHRIPPSFLSKEVLVDPEFLQDFACFGDVVFPHAFPGFIFRYVGGVAIDKGPLSKALGEEYPHISLSQICPSGENLFVEAPPKLTRDVIIGGVKRGFKRIFGVARESVVSEATAEPGWSNYSAFSAFIQSFYTVQDAYGLPADAFYPHPRGSMGGFVLERVRDFEDVDGYYSFLRGAFSCKRKKLNSGRRPLDLSPEDLLEIYITDTALSQGQI